MIRITISLLLLLLLLLLQVVPVKVNYNYFTLYKASRLNLKIIWSKRVFSFFGAAYLYDEVIIITPCTSILHNIPLYITILRWPTTAIHKYLLHYCILYLSTQTYSLAARVFLPVQSNIHQYNNTLSQYRNVNFSTKI